MFVGKLGKVFFFEGSTRKWSKIIRSIFKFACYNKNNT